MVVVNKESLRLLDASWDARAVYLLLGRSEDPAKYTAYVGEATKQGLRQRVSQHVRTEKNWDRALLVTSTDPALTRQPSVGSKAASTTCSPTPLPRRS